MKRIGTRHARARRPAAVLRRAAALLLALITLAILAVTADLAAAGRALLNLGSQADTAVTLLSAELGKDSADGLTEAARLVLAQSPLLSSVGTEALAAEPSVSPEETATPAPAQSTQPAADTDDSAESPLPSSTTAPDTIQSRTLTAGTSEAYVSSDGVYVYNYTDYDVDVAALAKKQPAITLTAGQPQILIMHTHTTEAYTQDGSDVYAESDTYRTTNDDCNVVRVGEAVAQVYRDAGLQVIHDTTFYDYPAYNGAYGRSGAGVKRYLEQYPSIKLVLDIHRDALTGDDGTVYKAATEIGGEQVAQVMLVVGTDAGGLTHPDWRQNLALAIRLQSSLNEAYPTLARPIVLRTSRFNQQLTHGSLLLEVGSHGNTLQEAVAAGKLFAKATAPVFLSMVSGG